MFSENYDRTLWLLLISDKIGRDRIVNFIKDIPVDCYGQIQEMITKYEETRELQSLSLVKTFNSGLNKLYFDAHIFEDGELSMMIRKHTTEDKVTKSSEFLLRLMPINSTYLTNLPVVSRCRYIGEIRDVKRNVVVDTIANMDDSIFEISYEKKFGLRRTPAGYFVSVDIECLVEPKNMLEDSDSHVKYLKKVNVSKIPEKMYVHQFDNNKRVKRLIRGKKRNIIRSK